MKIAVIDIGGQYAHRIHRTLQNLTVESIILPVTTSVEELNAQEVKGIAFSGSASRVGLEETDPLENLHTYFDNFEGPILGMCAAHQLIAEHFGGKATPAKVPEYGKTEIIVDKHDDLFKGLPEKFIAWNSHNDEVSEISEQLEGLAHSKDCKYEAIKHKEKPIFGLQFHPEVQHTEFGSEIFKNFVDVVESKV